MRLLLDAQAWLWWISAPDRRGVRARELTAARENQVLLSAVSALEISIKSAFGKPSLDEPPELFVPKWAQRSRVDELAVDLRHALRAGALPPHHREPFDRLLVAQAQVEGLPIVTADRQLSAWEVEIVSAE